MTGDDLDEINSIRHCLSKQFNTKDLREPREFSGIKITRDKEQKFISFSQEEFVTGMLEKFGLEEMRPV